MLLRIEDIEVEVTRKRVRNLNLRIRRDGSVALSAPRWVSQAELERFVRSKLDWIRTHQARIVERQERAREAAESADSEPPTIWIWGKRYMHTICAGKRADLVCSGTDALQYVRPGTTPECQEAQLREWYRAELCREVERLLPMWERRMGLACAEWRTKVMKTRWGTCNTRARRIWLNVRLAEHPRTCLEYVIVHELAHLVEPNHGPRFQAIMDRYLPDWRERRQLLNKGPAPTSSASPGTPAGPPA
jgi:predicted metal-dependent hydrolase